MTKEQLAWLAGILDGEGCFCIFTTNGRSSYGATVCVGATDRRMADTTFSWTGLGKVYCRKPQDKKYRSYWEWRISNSVDILALLAKVSPYLVIKQKQAKLLVKFCTLRSAREYEDLPYLYVGMRLLNRRGTKRSFFNTPRVSLTLGTSLSAEQA